MKGLILAAGKGTRLYPLTKHIPKPLITIGRETVIESCINRLLEIGIKDIGVVIDKEHELLFKSKLVKYDLTYIYQEEKLGVPHAIYQAKEFINEEEFITILGDNLINQSVYHIKKSLEVNDLALSCKVVDNPKDFGIIETHKLKVIGLEEKPNNPKSRLASMGVYGFRHNIFKAIENAELKGKEYIITDAINYLINNGYKIGCVNLDCIDIGTFERLNKIKGEIENGEEI